MVTPFTPDNRIDRKGVAAMLEYFAECGCDGVFAVCQSSEMFTMSDDECLELAECSIGKCRQLGMDCVVSGHVQRELGDQISYLKRLEQLNPGAVVLVTNRLAAEGEGDDRLIANLHAILGALDPKTKLGMYECPYPYKRLLSPEVLDEMIRLGRFVFVKDTSIDSGKVKSRLRRLKDSGIRLFNACTYSLRESVEAGAAGYAGVMLNYYPEVFGLLKRAAETEGLYDKKSVGDIMDFIMATTAYERSGYPQNAKIMLKQAGIIGHALTRNGGPAVDEAGRAEIGALRRRTEIVLAVYGRQLKPELIVPESPPFKACHAATVLPLDNGDVLAAYFAGESEGAGDVGIWLSKRKNGRWLPPVLVAKDDESLPHWNPVLYRTPSGIRLAYKVSSKTENWETHTRLSRDGGETWSDWDAYPTENMMGGPVRNKPIRLSNGTVLAPRSAETKSCWLPGIDVSMDGGDTFRALAEIPLNRVDEGGPNFLPGLGAIQPTLWESEPGHVHALMRTTGGRIYRSDSADCGESWREAYSTPLPNNNSGIDLAQYGGGLYLAMNPVYENWGKRTPMVIKRSLNNGKTFHRFLTLDCMDINPATQSKSEFSYPAVVEKGGALHIVYTHNRSNIAYHEIDLKNVEW
jgi:predicted neuraminidase/dihydrodipicolinate synthase/N-acetylneuraminate lyase